MAVNVNEAAKADHNVESRIELYRDEITFGSDRRQRSTLLTGRRLRRFLETGLFVAVTGVIVLAAHAAGGDRSPGARAAASPSPSQSVQPSAGSPTPAAHPRLVAPQTAVPGERLIVLAYRDCRLCGAAELRFDGAPTTHQILRYAGPANRDYVEMFMTMEVPKSAKSGRHDIELHGPRPGGRGPICGDVPEHQSRLATTTILVESARG